MPRITPEPFRLTITLVDPFDSPSEGLSTPPRDPDHSMAARTSVGQPFVPPPPSATASRESESVPQLKAAVQEQASPLAETARGSHHIPALQPPEQSMVAEQPLPSESHAVPVRQPATTDLPDRHFLQTPAPALRQHTAPLAEMARNPEPPAAFTEPARAQEIATEQPMHQAIKPPLHPTSRSSDQPTGTGPVAPHAPSDAKAPAALPTLADDAMSVAAPAALPVTRNDGELPPMVATRGPAVDHGSSLTAGEPGPILKDTACSGQAFPASSAQTRPPADYGWLKQALSRRLEELKRSSRPSMDDSGRLRVLVKAVVSSTGELMEAEIVNSSGHHRIDQEAMTLVHGPSRCRGIRTWIVPRSSCAFPSLFRMTESMLLDLLRRCGGVRPRMAGSYGVSHTWPQASPISPPMTGKSSNASA